MKKNNIKLGITFFIAGVLSFTQSYANAQDATTHAQVEFVEGQGPTVPVDPDNPEVPGNGGEGEMGSLIIVDVSDFDFDSVEIAPGNKAYDINTSRPNIQVVDLRGTGAGWKVSASLSKFTKGGTPSLPGASVGFVRGRPRSLSVSPPPVQEEYLELTSDDEPITIITAPEGAGTGLWIMRWYPQGGSPAYVTLNVPSGSATLGSHSATISWILADTPSAPPQEPED